VPHGIQRYEVSAERPGVPQNVLGKLSNKLSTGSDCGVALLHCQGN
jgi:hypothetical protein